MMRWMRGTPYKPIAAYGVIGDTRTAALIGMDGSIDWCCFPRFDGRSVFGALLDDAHGGRFRIAPTEPYTADQRYLPLTNVLVTTFHTHRGSGVGEVLDFMPIPGDQPLVSHQEIHRRIRGGRGEMELEITDTAALRLRARQHPPGTVWQQPVCIGWSRRVRDRSARVLAWELDDATATARARVTVRSNEQLWVVLAIRHG
jgi:hypothetical protein